MKKDILLVGGGHSHVQVLESLHRQPLADARVTVVVDRAIAVYSGMVPGFVAGQYRAAELEIDIPALCGWAGVDCLVEPVVRIEASNRRVHLAGGATLSYDIASLNIGSTVAGLELPGVREFAIPTRPIAALLDRIDQVMAAAMNRDSTEPFRLIVVGGGAGGVELAFTFRERLMSVGCGVVATRLITAGPGILEGYPAGLSRRAAKAAASRGIEIRRLRRVCAALADRVRLEDGEEMPYDALLWVTGAVGHPLLPLSELPTEPRGFVRTRPTLQVAGFDDLFAVGDCATLIDHPDTAKAGVYAVRQGPVLTRNLRALVAGESLLPYRPQRDFLSLLNLGDGTALGAKKGLSFEGRWVMALKDWIDRRFMRRFQIAATPGSEAVA